MQDSKIVKKDLLHLTSPADQPYKKVQEFLWLLISFYEENIVGKTLERLL